MGLEYVSIEPKAGKNLLKICMGDIYPNPMVVYREYVQNSCDSLQEAEQCGLFSQKTEKTVSISIESKSITIHDRGVGVKNDDVEKCLIWLSYSQKTGQAIGRYGIGRLTGAKYCDELVFETSACGEPCKNTIHFNAKKAREILASDEEYEVQEVIKMVTTRTRDEEKVDQHYFRVTLDNVFERHLLDEEMAKRYLAETVPVDYSTSFKDYILNPAFEKNSEFESLCKELITCNVFLNGTPIRKPYDSSVTNSSNQEERVGNANFFKLEHEGELLAWGWYAMTVSAKQFTGTVPFRKIRLRQLNMAVGDETYFDNLYSKDADSSYFIGEVFAVHESIEPTTGREGLTDNDYKKMFEYQLKTKFKSMAKEYYDLSKFGSGVLEPLAKGIRSMRAVNRDVDLGLKTLENTKNERAEINSKIQEAKKKLQVDLTKIRKAGKIDTLIDGIVEYYQELSDAETEKYNNLKDVQKANSQIKKVNLKSEIDKIMGEKSDPEPTDNTPSEDPTLTPAPDNNEDSSSPNNTDNDNTPSVPTDDTPKSELDVYKSLTSLERGVIKKVYKILNGQKDLAPSIREKLKNKMVKQLTKK